jgi:hypothetical protein
MTQATMARPHAPRRTFPPIPLIALIVVGALLCALMIYAVRAPKLVSRVSVDNPSAIDVNVSVRPSADGAQLLLATVPPGGQADNRDVLDQGDTWVFSFSSGGVEGGTLRVSRAKLASDDWRVEIPGSVVDRLKTKPFVPAYRG